MFQTPLRRPLTLIAGAALAVFLLLRSGFLVRMVWGQSSADDLQPPYSVWILDTAIFGGVLVAVLVACGWLMGRIRLRDREQTRLQHLAEVGLLASGLTHEIRNTLNAMHSQLALLRKHLPADADSQAHQRAGKVELAITELEELVADFLAFARPSKDRLEEVNLAKLIGSVLDFAAMDLDQGHVKVETDFDRSVPSVYADACKLKRAVLNLIINARQAMPDGGTLTVRLHHASQNEVVIEVCDTGCGIPEKNRPSIFTTFFSTKAEGTGLGLAVVRRTIEDCGGRVTFDSEVGKGTTFRIYLPSADPRRLVLHHEARDRQPVDAVS